MHVLSLCSISHLYRGISIRWVAAIAIIFLTGSAGAQDKFNAILYNKLDSTAVPYASVRLSGTNYTALTDSKGTFSIEIPANTKSISLDISAIGCKATVSYHRPFNKTEKIYIDLTPGALEDVSIKGLSAEDVVRKAVAMIPVNYEDSSYFDYSLYRYYEQVNGKFINLIEAEPVVMFRLTKRNKEIKAEEAFAIKQVRRSRLRPFIYGESNKEDLPRIMSENPVYHLTDGALAPGKFNHYSFTFDTGAHSDDYVIDYTCIRFSSDGHGGLSVAANNFPGESWETGSLIIDRNSFAIKQAKRATIRNPRYTYPKYNNFVLPDRKYTCELVDAQLEVNYEQENDKWYVKSIYHRYCNDYFTTGPTGGKKAYTINDVYEWVSIARSKYVTKEVADMYSATSQSQKMIFTYNKPFWDDVVFPFHYNNRDSVYNDIERNGPLEEQFYAEGLKTGDK